jgi:hypothetical protein
VVAVLPSSLQKILATRLLDLMLKRLLKNGRTSVLNGIHSRQGSSTPLMITKTMNTRSILHTTCECWRKIHVIPEILIIALMVPLEDVRCTRTARDTPRQEYAM